MASRRRFGIRFIGEIDGKFHGKSNEYGPKLLRLVFFEQITLLWKAVLIKLKQRWKFFLDKC